MATTRYVEHRVLNDVALILETPTYVIQTENAATPCWFDMPLPKFATVTDPRTQLKLLIRSF